MKPGYLLCALSFVVTRYCVVSHSQHPIELSVYLDGSSVSEPGCVNSSTANHDDKTTTVIRCDSFNSLSNFLNELETVMSIEVLLSPEIHLLTHTITFSNVNVTLRPTNDDRAHIVCHSAEFLTSLTQQEATPVLQFLHSNVVQIHNIYFEGCPGSVFIQNVSHLYIQNGLFR